MQGTTPAPHFLFPSSDDAFHVGEQYTPIARNSLFLSVEAHDHDVLAGCCGDAENALDPFAREFSEYAYLLTSRDQGCQLPRSLLSRSAQLYVMQAGATAGAKPRPPQSPPTGSHRREGWQHSPAGLLGKGVGVLLLLGPVEAREGAAVAFGTAWVLLEPGRGAMEEAGLDGVAGLVGVAFFSGILASATGWKRESKNKSCRPATAAEVTPKGQFHRQLHRPQKTGR